MRREGLFRYVNLLTLFAVGIALLFAITAPPHRVAFAANICGEPDGSPDPTLDDSFVLTMDAPASAAPLDDASATASFSGTPPAVTEVRLIWDVLNPQIVSYGSEEGGSWLFFFTVPPGEPGSYQLVACYGVDAGEGVINWFVSGIALFDATETALCQPDWEASQSPPPTLVISPESGAPNSLFSMSASGGDLNVANAVWAQAVWDWEGPTSTSSASGTVLGQGPHNGGATIVLADLIVPDDASLGDHDVMLCYVYFDGEGYSWWSTFVELDLGGFDIGRFTVTAALPPPTSCTSDETDDFLELAYQDGENPHSGPTGSFENVVISDFEGSLRFDYYLIWDFEGDDPFVVGSYFGSPTGPLQTTLGFTVPFDVAPGTYDIGVCELFSGEGGFEWIASPNVIQFTVLEYGVCGDSSPFNPYAIVTVTPNTGPVGTVFQTAIDATNPPPETDLFDDAYLIQVIWDWEEGNADFPPTGLVLTQVVKNNGNNTYTIPSLSVPNVPPGTYAVNVCYYIPFDLASSGVGTAASNEGVWVAGLPDNFTVTSASGGPPTNTPIPPTNTPGVIFGPGPPTPTPTVPPTSTPEPTATPPPLGTIAALAPTATPPVSGTQAIPGTGVNGGGGGGTTPIGGPGPNGGTNPNTGPTEPAGTAPAGSPTAAPPSPTATARSGTPSPTPTATPSPVPSKNTDEVLGTRSEFVRSVPGAKDVSGDMDVLATNIVLTAIVLILIFLTSEIFNQTIRDNQDDIESWLHNFFGPVIGFWAGLSALMGVATLHNQKLKDLFWLGLVLVITVLIEGFLNPGFGFNKSSVILFLSLLVAVGLITYLTEGGEAFIARTLFGQDTAVRVFPLAIGIALLCVVLSRLGEVVPGILYGFVGTAVFLRPSTLNKDQDGQVVFLPMAFMLVLSVICWLLVDSFRGPDASDFDAFIEGILVGIFLGTIEGVAINMVPIAYMDGRKLIDWNPLVWIATAGVAVFLVWEVLLNDQRAYFNSLQETTTAVAIIAVGSCFGLSVITWLWFRYRPGGHA